MEVTDQTKEAVGIAMGVAQAYFGAKGKAAAGEDDVGVVARKLAQLVHEREGVTCLTDAVMQVLKNLAVMQS